MDFGNFEEFWTYYVMIHTKLGNRLFHLFGIILCPILAIILHNPWLLLLTPFSFGLLSFVGHSFIEKNHEARKIKTENGWVLKANLRMFNLMMRWAFKKEISRIRAIKNS